MLGDDGVDEDRHRVGVADIAVVELKGQSLDRAPRTGDNNGTLTGEDRTDSGADAAHAAGHQDDATGETEVHPGTVGRQGHCASVPSKCLLRYCWFPPIRKCPK